MGEVGKDMRPWIESGGLPARLRNDLRTAGRLHESYDVSAGLARFRAQVGLAASSRRWLPWVGGIGLATVAAIVTTASLLPRSHGISAERPMPLRSEPRGVVEPALSEEGSGAARREAFPPVEATVAPAPRPLPKRAERPAAGRPSDALEEYEHLARVRALAERDPEGAVRAAAEGDRMYPEGLLHQEREALAIDALVRLGRLDEARARAATFLRAYPNGPFSEKVGAITKR